MTDAEFTEYRQHINGQIAALKLAVYALIDHAQDRPLLASRIEQGAEQLTANWLTTSLPDEFLEAFRAEVAALQSRAQSS